MADLHYREKLKSIEQAASTSNKVPEKAKNLGMGCFMLALITLIVFFIFLAISLFMHTIIVGSIVTSLVAIACIYLLIKLGTAPNLPL